MRVHVGRRAKRLENAATTVQTHIADEGERRASEPARAAASCRRRDLVRRLTAGKTEFVKSEPPLMRKNTDTCPNTASQPIRKKNKKTQACPGNRDGTRAAGRCWNRRVHTNSRTRSGPGASARPRSLRRGVGLRLAVVCAHMCVSVCVSLWPALSFQPARPGSPCVHLCICACVSLQRVRFPIHHKTQNAMTNKSLISSFLPQQHKAQPNPCANTPSAGRGRRRRRPTCGVFVFGREGRRRRRRRTARGGWI